MVENWCLKCKESTVMIDIVEGTAKNGRGTLRGFCAECGSKMFKFGRLAA